MLKEIFFSIQNIEITASEINAILKINANHLIFEGHFPEQPIVPGVCMMQMVKEVLEIAIEKKTILLNSSEMKFLAVINPFIINDINANLKISFIDEKNIVLIASLNKIDITYFKFKGNFLIN
ncbi:MAG: 3-hydroxyacyl-ACP dehydratase [Bacteroidetes bacterium]|nr:3-hydroxyacyl-ACP dehydratase [Bacteroidota bacterium]